MTERTDPQTAGDVEGYAATETAVDPATKTAGPAVNDAVADDEVSRIGSRLTAIGLLGAAALIGFGWYASTRAGEEQNDAVAAAIPVTAERILDDFERPDGVLGDDEASDPKWSVLGPELKIIGGQLVSDGSDQASLAVTDTGWADVSLGLIVGDTPAGSGLLFRFVDLNNHWSLVAAPDFATWNLVVTVDGEIIQSVATGLTSTAAGTRLAVLAQGPEIRVFVNGQPVGSIVDPTFQTATAAGVFASSGGVATFDEFFAVDAPIADE